MVRARGTKVDLGNAISMEDALSIMVVTFVLFFLFLIPLVNIDRTKLEEARMDRYWEKLSEWINRQENNKAAVAPYILAFGLGDHKVCFSDAGDRKYIEALSPEGEITVVMHENDRYISFTVSGYNAVVTYRYGKIRWSAAEREWFTLNNRIDYGENPENVRMQKEYREWTEETRGF
ncbi:MAG: hypothetical protein ACLFQB_15220 [Chitinispirillaceae bacterium]